LDSQIEFSHLVKGKASIEKGFEMRGQYLKSFGIKGNGIDVITLLPCRVTLRMEDLCLLLSL
jgi:hypothetical protein